MNKNKELNRRFNENNNFRDYIDRIIKDSTMYIQSNFRHLNVHDYKYDTDIAIEELGLDDEVILQLVEDYVIQIIKSKLLFVEYIDELRVRKIKKKELDYTKIRELAHKNLGVARNLRIKDSIAFLDEIMTKDDLDYIFKCANALEACAIKLNPLCAYETIKLIKLKHTL